MTCSDNVQNGDETEVDCGGKCDVCRKGCKDPVARNYDPRTEVKEDNTLCLYGDLDVVDNFFEATRYCDIPGATNYETHGRFDSSYYAESSSCNFCGNDTTEGTVKSDGTMEPVSFTGEISGNTVSVYESCDDGKNDKPYDGCYQCRLETCGDELALCQAYKFTGSESKSSLSKKISK